MTLGRNQPANKGAAGGTVADTVPLARAFARDVWNIDCVYEAALQVGRSAAQIPKHCAVPVAVIKEWQIATQALGSGRRLGDRKLANLLARMYKDVHAAALAEAVRVALAQSAKAKARHDKKKLGNGIGPQRTWRRCGDRSLMAAVPRFLIPGRVVCDGRCAVNSSVLIGIESDRRRYVQAECAFDLTNVP
jgi:hypothetical protein